MNIENTNPKTDEKLNDQAEYIREQARLQAEAEANKSEADKLTETRTKTVPAADSKNPGLAAERRRQEQPEPPPARYNHELAERTIADLKRELAS